MGRIASPGRLFLNSVMPPPKSTTPLLRSELIVTQAELDGVITYTVRDDVTGESFRMYAVEYAIAQRLNGATDLDTIIAAVKQDLQVDVTQDQLLRFLRELDQRGLIAGFVDPELVAPDAQSSAQLPLDQQALSQTATLHGAVLSSLAPAPQDDEATVASPNDAVAAGAFALVTQELKLHERGSAALAKAGLDQNVEVDPKEVNRMLRDAIHRMVGDDVSGAASILHAAQALTPGDARVEALVEATQTAYAQGTREATQVLKLQSAKLFPELMPEPLNTTRPDEPRKDPRRGLRPAMLVAASIVALGTLALAGWLRFGHGLSSLVVTAQIPYAAHQQRTGPALCVSGAPLATLNFGAPGVVAQLPAVGALVRKDEVIAALRLPPNVRQQLAHASLKLRRAETNVQRLQIRRQQHAQERRLVRAKLGHFAGRPPGGAAQARNQARLRLLDRQDRQVRAALVEAQSARVQAEGAWKAQSEGARSLQLIAPRAGTVGAVLTQVGQHVQAGTPALALVDPRKMRVTFQGPDAAALAPGMRAPVLVGKAGKRRIEGLVQPHAAAEGGPAHTVVLIEGPDLPLGPNAYTLLVADAPKALNVPRGALVPGHGTQRPYVIHLEDGRLHFVPVTVLDGDRDAVWVVPDMPMGGTAMPIVVQAPTVGLDKLGDGAAARTQ